MPTFAMIEQHTGYVWGVETAPNPIAACRQMDEAQGETGRTYEEGEASDFRVQGVGRSAFAVHHAPEGFDISDGQHKDSIAAVEALPLATVVLSWRKTEDEY